MNMRRQAITFSDELRAEVVQVWQQIGPDLLAWPGDMSNDAMVQAVLDSGLPTFGSPTALAEARALYKVHGFGAVCVALAQQLRLN